MARSYPTLDQRRSNAAFASSRSGPPSGVSNKKQQSAAYTNAAKRLWKLSSDWEVNLLMTVFGPERMGSIALAFDPSAKFQFGGQKIDVARRRRTRETGSYVAGFSAERLVSIYRNYIVNDDESISIVSEYLYYEGSEDLGVTLPSSKTTHTTFCEDSTDKLRAEGCLYNEMESCKVHDLDWLKAPSEPISIHEDVTVFIDSTAYERSVYDTTIIYHEGSPLAPIVDNYGFDDALPSLNASVKQFCSDHLDDVLTNCLSSRRLFNAFYQIGELKDLPMMIAKTIDTRNYLLSLLSDPNSALVSADKASGDAYLNYLFGYKSIEQVVKSLCRLPEKLAKRFNYLLRKNSKRVSQRFTQRYSGVEQLGELSPSWTYLVPAAVSYELIDEKVDFQPDLELRCVVNSTINFPQLAVPKFSDSTYRDMLGLNFPPRIIDLYNLVPWTWLGDWFTGLGKYLDMIETIFYDRDLINVGFITALLTSNIGIAGTLRMRKSRVAVYNSVGDLISETLGDPVDIPYRTIGAMDYRVRFSIDDLFGVKSVLDKQGLLTDDQKKILGALLTKFA